MVAVQQQPMTQGSKKLSWGTVVLAMGPQPHLGFKFIPWSLLPKSLGIPMVSDEWLTLLGSVVK